MSKKKFDFSGYATKANLKCSDGRVIHSDAFKHHDGQIVPLVWQHMHNDPVNVLGYAALEHREDGIYAYGAFNDTESGKHAKSLVEHGDIKSLSIHANQLKQKGSDVLHGMIREVSLVLAGANPGAFIDNISIQHGDGKYSTDESEAIIFTGEELSLTELEHDDKQDGETVKDVFETLNEKQKNVVYAMLAHAIDGGEDAKHSATEDEDGEEDDNDGKKEDLKHGNENNNQGGTTMKKNVFDKKDEEGKEKKTTLTHADFKTIITNAQKCGSLKEAVLEHAGTYGIDNIEYLFPDAKKVSATPDFIKRDMEWVPGVISGTRHTPFSRIKSMAADITPDAARAKGYVTGAEKTEEVFALLRRITYPTTVYKKQKLDRDDIIDITDMNVVAWLKMEMRWMLDEELARAVLVGDGRSADHADKIQESNIRPIYSDEALYSHKVKIALNRPTEDLIEDIIRARKNYKGSGNPVFYTTTDTLVDMLLVKDSIGRRLYTSEAELASALRVSKIVEVPVMEGITRVSGQETLGLVGIMVNLKDYVMGADKGGEINMFDDFDIDYNQYKYLMETRVSGALTLPKSALVIEKVQPAG
jgi:HK97 family phage prohead protease